MRMGGSYVRDDEKMSILGQYLSRHYMNLVGDSLKE